MHSEKRAIWVLVALFLSPMALSAQLMPGGRTVDVAGLRGDFYNEMVAKVNEVMDSWQSTWRKVGKEPVQQLYTRDATLLQPGGLPLKGRDEIRGFSETALPQTSALRTGMGDLEACEGFAYLSGYFAIDPARGDRGSSNGRHFTVILNEGGKWLLRHQFFLPDSGAVPFPGNLSTELLEPITNDQVRAGSRGLSRFAAFGDAQYILMALRDAWKRGDAADAASFFAEDAWVQLPHEGGNWGDVRSMEDRLKEGIDRYGEILSVELDFDRRDRLSFTFGRYHAEGVDGPDKPGHFLMLLRNAGNGWLIRALVFS
jgi:ketosteroid isomerase-like protein